MSALFFGNHPPPALFALLGASQIFPSVPENVLLGLYPRHLPIASHPSRPSQLAHQQLKPVPALFLGTPVTSHLQHPKTRPAHFSESSAYFPPFLRPLPVGSTRKRAARPFLGNFRVFPTLPHPSPSLRLAARSLAAPENAPPLFLGILRILPTLRVPRDWPHVSSQQVKMPALLPIDTRHSCPFFPHVQWFEMLSSTSK
ncbi:hypothetical protein R3P38DRAFT_3177876 [Favolaschia claudopus]|uniref:Uncharacterized protein n=1 Tax=Favolaschia claudopus TaxID=2862362 RepID=A0AAW0CXU2_9AGAR